MVDEIKTCRIYALHDVRDNAKLDTLTDAMQSHGWTGRPLALIEYADGYQALCGSHRLAAARAADLEAIPALVITADEAGEYYDDILACRDEDERLGVVREAGLMDLVALLARENKE